ncbi:hypothetical protein EV204_11238 [Tissierella praeacuta]|uniref:hypothetical protein n=1 Tax=Tissierella praeacuta TaxID=43131 RepID=UPI00104EC3CD|nr:hypothetical protein [Tissierella praeacuta]TCU67487.1 hypothetical protein EV204_11238 [Tissierella praeacuta]
MGVLSQITNREYIRNELIVRPKDKFNKSTENGQITDFKKEILKKAVQTYEFSNNGVFNQNRFMKDLIDILCSGLINSNTGNTYDSSKYIKKNVVFPPQTINEMVIGMKNDKEEKRNALINKLKLERVKFLNSPTAKLMIKMNMDYGKWEPTEELGELPLLHMTLSEEIDSGREERI